jgi:tight adherence protein B
MIIAAALPGILIMTGIIMMIYAFIPAAQHDKSTPHRSSALLPSSALSSAMKRRLTELTRRTKITIVIGVLLGLGGAAFSGILLLIVVIPAAVIGLPHLLGSPGRREHDLLIALESWSRSLSSAAETGSFTLREVITITRASAPPILRISVDRLVMRMSGTWSTPDALRQFATELNSARADEVVIYLIQAAEYNAGGVSNALDAVAEMLADTAKQQMDTALEREKPRRSLMTMTGIVVIVLTGIVLFSHTAQIALYRTVRGQLILAVILSVFAVLLLWAKSQTRVTPEPRILVSTPTDEEARS